MKDADLKTFEQRMAEARANWTEGPWHHEPDRVEWRSPRGLPCLIVRSATTGALCGYVGVPPGHPAHGKDCAGLDVSVHGGLNYSGGCDGVVCHEPAPGEADGVHWFGFDCGHAGDLCPLLASFMAEEGLAALRADWTYRDVAYVRGEVDSLAVQLEALSTAPSARVPRSRKRSVRSH